MFQRISGCLRGMTALGPLPLRPVLGIILSCVAADASMDNVRFALDYKPTYVYSKRIPYLCDNPATVTEEPNYSPNYTNTPCYSYEVSCQPFGPGQVYLVVTHAGGEGVTAASFGVSYSGSTRTGIDPAHVTWTGCADGLSFPNSDGVHGLFPQPGGGLRITWNTANGCPAATQEAIGNAGVHAVVGVFYVYAYSNDILRVTPNYNLEGGVPELAVANCAGITTDLVQIWGLPTALQRCGSVGFNEYGRNPCEQFAAPAQAPCTTPIRPTTWGRLKATYGNDR
jgi:hypothetical protein